MLAIEEINAAGGLLGRPLELAVEDTQMSTAVTLEKARQLLMRDEVAMLTGMVLPSEREAALQAAKTSARLVVYPNFEGRCDPLLSTGLSVAQGRTTSLRGSCVVVQKRQRGGLGRR